MPVLLAELAALVEGQLVGNPSLELTGASTLDTAGPSEISLLDCAGKAHRLARSAAAAIVAPIEFEHADRPMIQVADVHSAFAKIVRHFRPDRLRGPAAVSPRALIGERVKLGAGVSVYPGACIGDEVEIGERCVIHSGAQIMAGCVIGADSVVFPGAVLYENTRVGQRCIIHAGAVLGAYGFGYKVVGGRHQLSAQLGYVEIGSDVEVGAGSTIDRGTYGPTVIGEGTKIDNLVMIAHNCRLGKHNLICSQVGIAGSTTTGDYVVMAGQVGVRDHVHIGTGAVIGAKAGVSGDVRDGAHMLGTPAVPEREQKLLFAAMSKLPEMRKQVKEMRRQLTEMTEHHPPKMNTPQNEAA